jgi:hypothetical protein
VFAQPVAPSKDPATDSSASLIHRESNRENVAASITARPAVLSSEIQEQIRQYHEYYEWETIEPGRVETRTKAPVYKTFTSEVIDRPAYFRHFYSYDGAGNPMVVRVFVPTEVRYVRRKVLLQPARQETIVIPPKQQLVRKTSGVPVLPAGE